MLFRTVIHNETYLIRRPDVRRFASSCCTRHSVRVLSGASSQSQSYSSYSSGARSSSMYLSNGPRFTTSNGPCVPISAQVTACGARWQGEWDYEDFGGESRARRRCVVACSWLSSVLRVFVVLADNRVSSPSCRIKTTGWWQGLKEEVHRCTCTPTPNTAIS